MRIMNINVTTMLRILASITLITVLPTICLAEGKLGIAAYGWDGRLDPTFNGDGREAIPSVGAYSENDPEALAARVVGKLDGQGRLVVAGRAAGGAIGLTRYHLDGTVDKPSPQWLPCTNVADEVRGMTISMNTIILVGRFCNKWTVVRFKNDLTLDAGFGGGRGFETFDSQLAIIYGTGVAGVRTRSPMTFWWTPYRESSWSVQPGTIPRERETRQSS